MILLKKKNTSIFPVFRHELNHILLGQAFKGKEKVPRWLDEGLAMGGSVVNPVRFGRKQP